MTDSSNIRFNSEAETWDLNPDVQSATRSALSCLLERVPAFSPERSSKPRVLDLGAGTGLLSLALAPHASTILSVDPSPGMIAALTRKLSHASAPHNITPLCALLASSTDPALPDLPSGDTSGDTDAPRQKQKYDVIVSNLVLHHVADLPAFVQLTYDLLAPGGVIALTDFEDTGPEARRFHPEDKMEGVERHGIPRADMLQLLQAAGFAQPSVEVGWVLRKRVERFPGEWKDGKLPLADGEAPCEMDFNFLFITGRKEVST
ncbi:hypothetical protein DRE_06700 [Drechslerella stenobrocha 248]|uniref:Methyltransferase type 12 domain-containing protein n=1 Tax=Drechslerella stenobrocha 248 TaxID=1043628 RepID=W7HXA8_9PEZI|nr:hypothetical protein DRE_06700 [Drechslerella stenobrocha 248]